MDDLIGHSITYRIAVGPRAGQKLFTLQTVPLRLQGPALNPNGAARAGGFSLHAGVAIAASRGDELGTAAEAVVQERHRDLRALRRTASDHRQHRGTAGHCEDSGAVGANRFAVAPDRVFARGASATGAVQAALNSKRRGTGAGRQGGGLGTGARRQAGPGLWLGGHGVRPRARPGIQRPALRPTGHAGRRNDRPRTVGLRLEPGLLARYANSLRTGRRFEFPIRCHYSLEAARSAITRSSFATKSALASIRSISARCRSTSALTRAISLR